MDTLTEKKSLLQSLELLFASGDRGMHKPRRLAMDILLEKGLPGPKTEEYRFTPIARLLEKNFSGAPPTSSPTRPATFVPIPELTSHIVAFVNGKFSAIHSRLLDHSITISTSVPELPSPDQDSFDLLNQAFSDDIIHISITHPTKPLVIVYYVDSASFLFTNPRWVLQVADHCKVTMVELTIVKTPVPFFNNKHSSIILGNHSELEFTSIQNGDDSEILVNNSTIELANSSRVACFTVTLKGQLIRNNFTLSLNGEKIDARLNGLYMSSGESLIDNHTVVDHQKPNSYSNELYKGILDGQGKAVFNGKIFVRPDAQKTNAFQTNRNILLSEQAAIHTKPQLEIWADDVKCSHGCTTGQLDEEALFYLRSRGLSHDTARGMLLAAFASETLSGLTCEPVKAYLERLIAEKLHTPVQP